MSINRTITTVSAIAIAATGLVACNDTDNKMDDKMDSSMTPTSSAMMSEDKMAPSSAMMSKDKMAPSSAMMSEDKMMEESK
ncbi:MULTISPECIES: hypothetical protein [Corynebacterium]|uniref:hypothetical protein n=1 Tax=Corynebacterium TaxID=1716 RepID=UPI0021006BF8|nr:MULTISPECIES: hypothetical protein [Corynebacterium]